MLEPFLGHKQYKKRQLARFGQCTTVRGPLPSVKGMASSCQLLRQCCWMGQLSTCIIGNEELGVCPKLSTTRKIEVGWQSSLKMKWYKEPYHHCKLRGCICEEYGSMCFFLIIIDICWVLFMTQPWSVSLKWWIHLILTITSWSRFYCYPAIL